MSCCSEIESICKYQEASIRFLFDFSRMPEVIAGQTLSGTPTITGGEGLTIGTPAVTSTEESGIAAGKAVGVLIGGGTKGEDYTLTCAVGTSGGSTLVVKGRLEVE